MTSAPAVDGRLRRISFAVALGIFAVNLDFFGIQTALPAAADEFGVTTSDLQWAVSGYLLSMACFFIISGRLADMFGRRRFLILGVTIFGVTSLIGGMAQSPELLITMRAVQGIGAAIMFPVGLSIITNAYPGNRVQRAVGTVMGTASVGTAFGPLIAGILIDLLGWRWVLWVNVIVAVIVLFLVVRDVAESHDEKADRRIDWWGLVLIALSVGLFTYGIDSSGSHGWDSPRTIALISAGVVGFIAVVLVELNVRRPLLDLALFRIREFSVMVMAGAAGNMAALAVIFTSMIYLQGVLMEGALQAAVAFLSFSVPYAIGNQLSGGMSRFPSWLVMSVALIVGGGGTVLMGLATPMWLFLLGAALSGLGLGVAWAYASVVTQDVVPRQQAGMASGLVLTILVGLGGVAVAVASSVIEAHGQTPATTTTAIDAVLIGFGLAALAASLLVLLLGRRGARTSS